MPFPLGLSLLLVPSQLERLVCSLYLRFLVVQCGIAKRWGVSMSVPSQLQLRRCPTWADEHEAEHTYEAELDREADLRLQLHLWRETEP